LSLAIYQATYSTQRGDNTMKHNKKFLVLAILAVVCCFVISSVSTGVALAAAKPAKAAKAKTFTGMVEKADSGFVLKVGKKTYMVTGEDLAPMVGKKVKVTGVASKGDKGMTIAATKVVEVKAKAKAKAKKAKEPKAPM